MEEKTAEFLAWLTDTYRHCDSYQDSGIIQSTMTFGEEKEMLERDRQVRELPEMQKLMEAYSMLNPDYIEMHEECIRDCSFKRRRVYSHVLFDQDFDDSVFRFPT